MAEEATQTTAKPIHGRKHERLEIVDSPRALRFVLRPPGSGWWGMNGVLGVSLALVALAVALWAYEFDLRTDSIPLPAQLGLVIAAVQVTATIMGVLSRRRFMEVDIMTLTIGREPFNFGIEAHLRLPDVSNLRFVANWGAAKRGSRLAEKKPVQSLLGEESVKGAGIVCDYRGKPRSILLNLPQNTAEEILAAIYKRHPKQKPPEDA